MSTTVDLLLAVLRHHIGRRNGVTAATLVAEIRVRGEACNARLVRQLVTTLREKGHHVCAHPTTGYFLAETAEELTDTRRFLHHRAMSSLRQIAAMDRVSLPDLLGQLKLPT